MKQLKTIFNDGIALLVIIPIVLLLVSLGSLYLIIFGPFIWIIRRKFNKRYSDYLISLEGKNFFCYNNRKKGLQCIEQEIIPSLPEEVETIFLNGREIESKNYDPRYLSKAFYEFKNYTRFPQLLKIRGGKAIDCSLNTELFAYLNSGRSKEVVDDKIVNFFELEKNKKWLSKVSYRSIISLKIKLYSMTILYFRNRNEEKLQNEPARF